MLGNKLLNIQFAKDHIWNNKFEGFPNMVLSTETFNQSVRTEYSEAVNSRYTFQPLWVSGNTPYLGSDVTFLHVSLPPCGLCVVSADDSANEIGGACSCLPCEQSLLRSS